MSTDFATPTERPDLQLRVVHAHEYALVVTVAQVAPLTVVTPLEHAIVDFSVVSCDLALGRGFLAVILDGPAALTLKYNESHVIAPR